MLGVRTVAVIIPYASPALNRALVILMRLMIHGVFASSKSQLNIDLLDCSGKRVSFGSRFLP